MLKRKIYVASSWRNEQQPAIVELLRALGHEVYDFRNPPNRTGFSWDEIDTNWLNWTPDEFRHGLATDIANKGFHSDFDGMKWADTCVMVLPCGRSANTEAGWCKGAGKEVFVLQTTKCEPELMYKMYDGIITSVTELHVLFAMAPVYEEQFTKCDTCGTVLSAEDGVVTCVSCLLASK